MAARAVRAGIALILAVLLMGATTAFAQTPSPTPSGSASPSGGATGPPSIALLNPSPAYDPKLDPDGQDPPKVSDKDRPYHVVAWTGATPQNAVVELVLRQGTNEFTIGVMDRVNEYTWEYYWDIPNSIAGGAASLTAYLYDVTFSGTQEVANDTVPVDMRHTALVSTPDDPVPDETIEPTVLKAGGPLGFYKPPNGQWRAGIVLEGNMVQPFGRVEGYYSTSARGSKPVFRKCATTKGAVQGISTDLRTHVVCTLFQGDVPSKVTAIAAVAETTQDVATGNFGFTQESAVAFPVVPYLQNPKEANVRVTPWARGATSTCLPFIVSVTDQNGQPIVGANLDAHAQGPTDQLHFTTAPKSTESQAPDKGHTGFESTASCGTPTENTGQEARHRDPGGPDEIHRETAGGAGVTFVSGVGASEWWFSLRSDAPGITSIQVWVDGEPLSDELAPAAPDSDTVDEGEPFVHAHAQWFGGAPKLSIDPVGRMGLVGGCVPFTVKARSKTAAMPNTNVDVHATGPDAELDFCNPAGGSQRNAPDPGPSANPHTPEDDQESHHEPQTAPGAQQPTLGAQHTEGQTDTDGNFTFGLSSASIGDTTVIAWLDGEAATNDDNQSPTEPSSRATLTWGNGEPRISFINPSPYGGTTEKPGTGTQLPDRDGTTKIRTRVWSLQPVESVQIFLVSTDSSKFLGYANQIGSNGLYELPWDVNVPDGAYKLRAQVTNTSVTSEIAVQIGAGDQAPNSPRPSFEMVAISKPANGTLAPFVKGGVRITGTASPGTETIDLFYTKVPSASDTPKAPDWILCGYVDLDGLNSFQQSFTSICQLQNADQPNEVTGLAAITFDCNAPGCDGQPDPAEPSPPVITPPPSPAPQVVIPRQDGQKETGDAISIFGYEASPLLALEPPEQQSAVGPDVCQRLEIVLRDQTGQPIRDGNVDLHFNGPEGLELCDPGNSSEWRAPDEGEHFPSDSPTGPSSGYHQDPATGLRTYHVEADTPQNGRLIFGLGSEHIGDSSMEAWLDRADNDVQDAGEPIARGLLHWVQETKCTLMGTTADDGLVGTPAKDYICGLGGNDEIKGRGSNDVLIGGRGRDLLIGGPGRDALRGGKGPDRLNGSRGKDRCKGGPGKDRARSCENGKQPAPPRRHNLV